MVAEFNQVGEVLGGVGATTVLKSSFATEATRAAAHGFVGYATTGDPSAAMAGAFGSVASSFGANISGLNTILGGTAFSAAVGGISSVIAGGNFVEGATFAAMGHLTNQMAHDKVVSLKKWVKLYEGKTYTQIAGEEGRQSYLKGLLRPRLGPTVRYVNIGNGIILDMRHVLVMGMEYGLTIGEITELGQIISDPSSAMNPKDFLSNEIGAGFLDYLKQSSVYFQRSVNFGKTHDTYLSNHFYNYIKSLR